MSNGAAPAVLLRELIHADGPHLALADAFVAHVCMSCRLDVEESPQFAGSGFYCTPCSSRTR
jgi:hypothetical protein